MSPVTICRRVCPLTGIGAILVCAVLSPRVAQAQDPVVFRATADAVAVGVSVRRNGRPVRDLDIEDFMLTDNGIPQRLVAFGYERLPIDLTIVLDVSGSVTGPVITQLRNAVNDVRRSLQSQDRLRVMTFNARVHRLLDFDAPESINDAFAAVAPGGSSAALDALAVALASSRASTDRREMIILFSDGRDSSSVTTPAGLLNIARGTTPTVSIVLATPARLPSDQVYTELAAETGGTVVSLLPTDNLGNRLRGALEQFRSSYVLTYVPEGVGTRGTHALDIRVDRPDVEVRGRRGYVVP